jgi:pimeloyl-ACP methyl ester carboxylesterase
MIQHSFTLPAEGGERIHGDLRLPEGQPPKTAVVVVHGFKGFKDWGFFPHLCEALVAEGHATVSFNFSLNGIGDDFQTFTRLDAFERNTLSREVAEVGEVLSVVRDGDLLSAPPHAIGLLGHSRGGGVAVLGARSFVEKGGQLDALVTWAAVGEFGRWSDEEKVKWRREGKIHAVNSRTGQKLPLGLGLLEDFERNREVLDVVRAGAALGEVPWLIVHGEQDETVSVEDARRLNVGNPEAMLEIVSPSGHTFQAKHPFDGSNPILDRVVDRTLQHFRRYLARAE